MSDFNKQIDRIVNDVSERIQKTWPLYSFVTSNPLAGFEDQSFAEALQEAGGLFGGHGFPQADQFRQALSNGNIDDGILRQILREEGYEQSPERLLDQFECTGFRSGSLHDLDRSDRQVNQILEKWLSAYLDEGQARWEMPNREQGFYSAWVDLAPHDHHIPEAGQLEDLPKDRYMVLEELFEAIPENSWKEVVSYHLSALPGWMGYIKHRDQRSDDGWSDRYPIDPVDYLTVRLLLVRQLDASLVPDPSDVQEEKDDRYVLHQCFLEAWEKTYQRHLLDKISPESMQEEDEEEADSQPDAQFVFCIDTRSEIIRRHIESTGQYETHGYAGFFGIPVRRRAFGEKTHVDACPPIVDPDHYVEEQPGNVSEEKVDQRLWYTDLLGKAKRTLKEVKDNIAAAFSFVEFSGLFYGLGLVGRTLWPGGFASRMREQVPQALREREHVFEPDVDGAETEGGSDSLTDGLRLEHQVQYARSAFEMMGWDTFSPAVVFAGHVSETVNNPFDASLRCGACAGNSGVPNAKMLAEICNKETVRQALEEEGINIPDETVFLAARHNTTTDEITLFDEHVTEEVPLDLEEVKQDLEDARRAATEERMMDMPDYTGEGPVEETDRRSSDWAQVRPEWGLAGNASFIIGPNKLRHNVDLEGRAFLHSYQWNQDEDGTILENIMNGPMVVCQWINHQYYFSTVDNAIYGSGSKITHNPVGNFGVVQGNGGDLMGGLPLESLMASSSKIQHKPIRITNVIYAPQERVQRILDRHEDLRKLVENRWMHLVVIDPLQNDAINDLQWRARREEMAPRMAVASI